MGRPRKDRSHIPRVGSDGALRRPHHPHQAPSRLRPARRNKHATSVSLRKQQKEELLPPLRSHLPMKYRAKHSYLSISAVVNFHATYHGWGEFETDSVKVSKFIESHP